MCFALLHASRATMRAEQQEQCLETERERRAWLLVQIGMSYEAYEVKSGAQVHAVRARVMVRTLVRVFMMYV